MPLFDNFRKASAIIMGGGRQIPTSQDVSTAIITSGMDSTTNLGPGTPIWPADGIAQPPRLFDYPTGYNIAARPRSQSRVSFWTLKNLVDNYDIAQMCISHRIDSIRSVDWDIVAAKGVTEDVSDQITRALAVMKRPDGIRPFKTWLGAYLYDILAYDAGALSKMYNNAGQPMGLEVVDGLTIAPLIDEYGRQPTGDAPAYVQFVQGQTWNWILAEDFIYLPFRPQPDSMYGRSPIESVLLTANTDLRFQQYFLQAFTDGNVPQGFGISPENWGPDQINDWQKAWDAAMLGNAEAQHQIRWVPGGSKFEFPNQQKFDPAMSKWLLTKTAAAYHVPPADLGFTDTVNKSSGETQADVSNRVGDLPLQQHIAEILTNFLQDDCGLQVEFQWDLGREEEDRLATAQADQVYMNSAVVSPSEIRAMRYGIEDPADQIVPRAFITRQGPVTVATLIASSPEVDPTTALPNPGTIIPAEQTAQQAVGSDSADPTVAAVAAGAAPAVAAVAPTATPDPANVSKAAPLAVLGKSASDTTAELAAFRRFVKARKASGSWRPFEFTATDDTTAHRLNVSGYVEVRKAAGEIVAAGVAVRAADTGRVLMLQRALDPTDPAAGKWEFPGGCIELGETPMAAAWREWQEETGQIMPDGTLTGDWCSPNGVYCGYVFTIPAESMVPVRGASAIGNPDDPDGDITEAIAWWSPQDLVGNPIVRAELAADASLVLGAINTAPSAMVVEADAAPLADPLAKSWRDSKERTPQMRYDLAITDQYAPQIAKFFTDLANGFNVGAVLSQLGVPVTKSTGVFKADTTPGTEMILAAVRQELGNRVSLDELGKILAELYPDGWAAGEHSTAEQLTPHIVAIAGISDAVIDVDWKNWSAGDPLAADQINSAGLFDLLDNIGITLNGIEDTTVDLIGGRIANGLEQGLSINQISGDIADMVGSDSRAELIAHTETTRAVMGATFDVYDLNGVGQWDMLTSDGACPICLNIAAENPHPVSDRSDAPPVHPRCRCSAAPVPSSIVGANIIAEEN